MKRWDVEAAAKFFEGRRYPKKPIQLDAASTITNPKKFVETNLAMATRNNGIETFRPYWERLKKLKKILEENGKKKKKTASGS